MSNFTYKDDELMHYGVLGMKWGVHRAKVYSRDYNEYNRKQKNRAAKLAYKQKQITKEQYKEKKRENAIDEYNANVEVNNRLRKLTPNKAAKMSSIYKSYQNKTLSTIPHYRLKKGAKITGRILGNIGLSTLTAGLGVAGLEVRAVAESMAGLPLHDPSLVTGLRAASKALDVGGAGAFVTRLSLAQSRANKRAAQNSYVPIKKKRKK